MGWSTGPRAKWGRANEHALTLQREIGEFVKGDGYSLAHEVDFENGEYRIAIRVRRHPDFQRWALLLGDFCTNATAALDHLAYALTIEHTKQDPPPGHDAIYSRSSKTPNTGRTA